MLTTTVWRSWRPACCGRWLGLGNYDLAGLSMVGYQHRESLLPGFLEKPPFAPTCRREGIVSLGLANWVQGLVAGARLFTSDAQRGLSYCVT